MTNLFYTLTVVLCVYLGVLPSVIQGQPQQGQPDKVDQQMIDTLAGEIDAIIPGEYAKGSEEDKLIREIATAYLERKANRVINLLDQLAANDANLPPKDLILAGISFATNNPLQGRNLLERVGIDHREHPGVALAFGRFALLQGRYFDAFTIVQHANELAKASSFDADIKKYYEIEAHNTMTIVEMRRNDMARAAEMVKKWAELAPESDDMLLASAEIQFQKAEFTTAVQLLDQRSEKMKQDLPTSIVMTKWFRSKSAFNRMEIWINKAYQQHPDNPVVQLEYAGWLLRNSKYDEAEKLVDQFEQAGVTGTLDTLSIKGRIAFGRTRYEDAAESFKAVYQRQPNNFENSTLYIFSLLESAVPENHQQAIVLAQRNFQAFPNSQLAILAMAVALEKAGNLEASDQLLERAARIGTILPDTAYFMARKLKKQDRGLQAKIMLDSFLESKDTFLYREKARQLVNSIGDSESSLPEPDSKDGK